MSDFPFLLRASFALITVLGPLPVAVFSTRLNRRSGLASPTEALITIATVWFVSQGAIGTVLIGVGHYQIWPMIAIELMLLSTGFILLHTLKPSTEAPMDMAGANSRPPLLELAAVATIAIAGIINVWTVASQPITNFDSLAFHLQTVVRWIKTGSFTIPDQYDLRFLTQIANDAHQSVDFKNAQVGYYPYMWESISGLFALALGNDSLIALPQLIAWLLLGLSIYSTATRLGARRLQAIVSSGLLLIYPIVSGQINSLKGDLALATFFAVGVYYIFRYRQTGSLVYLGLLAPSLGLLASVRTPGIVYSGLLVGVILVSLFERGRRERHRPQAASVTKGDYATTLFLGIPSLIVGLAWYLRNFLETGNPLGIVAIEIGGVAIFPGVMPSGFTQRGTMANLFSLTSIAHWRIMLEAIDRHLGLPFVATIALGLIGLKFAWPRRAEITSDIRIGIFLIIAAFLLYWYTPYGVDDGALGWQVTPFIGQAFRYGLSFLGLVAICAAVIASRARFPDELLFTILAVLMGDSLGTGGLMRSGLSAIVIATIIGGYVRAHVHFTLDGVNWFRIGRHAVVIGGLVALAVVIAIMGVGRGKRDVSRNQLYGGIAGYVDAKIPRGSVIGFSNSYKAYYLYGRSFDNEVKLVPPRTSDISAWLAELRAQGVTYFAVGPLEAGLQSPQELAWLDDQTGTFTRLLGTDINRDVFLYRLR